MNSKLIRNLLFGLLVAGYIYYGLRYIETTTVTVGDQKYYVLFDDAMISMRYAYNLAHGLGPVWNAGERVEGFTNPLWVGYMALFHLLPIPLAKIGLYIQLSGLAFMAGTLYFVRKIVEEFTGELIPMLAAVAFTAFYNSLNSWALLGMEVSILTLILTASVYLAFRAAPSRVPLWTLRQAQGGAYILLAVSTLFRFDMAVPFIVVFAVMFIVQKDYRKQHLIWGLGSLILFLGIQTLARYAYYGELLPNTYYLKVTGWPFVLRILRGLYTLVWFIYYTNWVLYLIPFTVLFFRRDWKINLILFLLLGQMAYSVYVGGDAWENHGGANRYIGIAMPLFFATFAYGVEILRQKAAGFGAGRIAEIGSRAAWIVIFVISIINFNLLLGDWKYIERLTFARKPDYVAGSERNIEIMLGLQATTAPGASVAVIGAGTIPYFLPDRYAIDILGKADPYIARQPVRAPMSIADVPTMRPGHMKWDYAHTIGELQPDVIVALWEGTSAQAEPYLGNYIYEAIAPGVKVYLLKDSPNIHWDEVIVDQ
jgi:arabinofuranosyltransferase